MYHKIMFQNITFHTLAISMENNSNVSRLYINLLCSFDMQSINFTFTLGCSFVFSTNELTGRSTQHQ